MDERDVTIILALADNRMNITEASRKLFMHRNTVWYHICKIKRETGLDPTDFYDLCKLVKMVNEPIAKQIETMNTTEAVSQRTLNALNMIGQQTHGGI